MKINKQYMYILFEQIKVRTLSSISIFSLAPLLYEFEETVDDPSSI